ncbi:Eco57I restriction-modification methylase domain-containing protein [Bifidobacterium boum]|uniref:Eco57I restriction-modification methylase domain-containing protein n=1 Tax=Bifidobacterium boum TaxID=78343 RepID=UPI003F920172
MVKELNETFPGIESVNDFYTPYYMKEYFPQGVAEASKAWRELAAQDRPVFKLKAMRQSYVQIVNNNDADLFEAESVREFIDGMLDSLGYAAKANAAPVNGLVDASVGTNVPVHYQVNDALGAPTVQVIASYSRDSSTGVLESPAEEDTGNGPSCEEYVRMLLSDFYHPARWVLVMGLHQIVLIDRRKWGDKRCVIFDLDTIFSRHQDHVYSAMAVLLDHDSLCPDNGDSVLDVFDEQSAKNAVEVSDGLRSALRECVEILGNEVIYDWVHNKQRSIEDIDAGELTLQALRYMYRLLFLLFIEAKPSLGYAPMRSEIYRTGYSLDSLRDIAEQMRGRMDEAGDTTYLADTLRQLDRLVFNGYPATEDNYKKVNGTEINDAIFLIPPLKAHIFDPERTGLIENAKLRDSQMLKIVDLMSVSKATKGARRRQRISYAALGISQMGAVYEALLSYRGFIAKEKLYEVKREKDHYDPLNVGYFVTEQQLSDYAENERVRYPAGDLREGELRSYEPGTFIYRLAGRERETSASYYTPDNLAQCLVKYAIKELEPRIHQATDILTLKICEPAMGSATFLNEVINQLASMYLTRREHELVAQKGAQAAIPAERQQAELQKVKMFIADRCIYGIDLNPVAVELGEVSLWLNTICEGSFVPWFGTQLVCGNSLVGARRAGYLESELTSTAKNLRWNATSPKRIGFKKSASSTRRIYHFLTGDPGMCAFNDKTIKTIESKNLSIIADWKKDFTNRPYSKTELDAMKQLSESIDALWKGQVKARRQLEHETRDEDRLSIYGYDQFLHDSKHADTLIEQQERGQSDFEGMTEDIDRRNHLSIREKDEMLRLEYFSDHAKNASEYARLKLAMDYWCALWFWPIDAAPLLPSRRDYLLDMALILTGKIPEEFELVRESDQPTFKDSLNGGDERDYMFEHEVDLQELCSGDNGTAKRLRLVKRIAEEQHFFHWELEFADVFNEGGFDLMIGNPPWVKLQWEAANAISDVNPKYAVEEISASALNKLLPGLMNQPEVRHTFIGEYVAMMGQLNFFNAMGNYPLLKGQQTNLFRCFLPNAWNYTRADSGVSAFVHPDEIYGDTRAGVLREQMYRRLRYHFQFINEKKLFAGVHHETSFGLNVYRNPSAKSIASEVCFDSIWGLYDPKTIDACYASDGSGEVPGVKNGKEWDTRGHRDRIIHVIKRELELFSRLVGSGRPEDWKQTPMIGVHATELLSTLEKMAEAPHALRDYDDEITYSGMWHETNSRKDGTIDDDIHFPDITKALIYSSPFIGVGNPLLQTTRRTYKSNSDYDPIDLTEIPENYLPRVKYSQACSDAEYSKRIQKMNDGTRFDAVYRLCNREYVGATSERTLQASCVHPGAAWVNTITGYGVHPERYALLALMSGLEASLPYDFFVRAAGKSHVNRSVLSSLPVPDSSLNTEIRLRGLLLNCLTRPYAELWKSCWEDSYRTMEWSKQDSRLPVNAFTSLTEDWDWHTPLRSDYARRQALVELDVLASMALGITLDELISIYKLTFTVLNQYEADTWYDANGRITFSVKKSYGKLTADRDEFNGWRNAPAGTVFTRTISDDTRPGGPRDRSIDYVAPFDTCDRIEDYKTAWAFFEHKYGGNR